MGHRRGKLGRITAGLAVCLLATPACLTPDAGTSPTDTAAPERTVVQPAPPEVPEGSTECRRWVGEEGDDEADGSRDAPWATLSHALDAIPASGCELEVLPGTYEGARVDRHYTGTTVLRSAEPYRAVLVGESTVLDVQGAHNVTIEGFEIKQENPDSRGVILNVEDANDFASTWITIRNNIIHDSFEDDLLKIRSAARYVTVTGNVFYNQATSEQHIDVNGVHDIVIEDNIFSNDFAATGRDDPEQTKAFIVVKDSSGTGDLGSRRVRVRRNVFLNWQGGRETLLQIGNDGEEYFEAIDVTVENNLVLGNSPSYATASFGAAGVKDVGFMNNTVIGDLPSGAFGAFFDQKGRNLPNEGIELRNNIFSDPTGSMGDFTNGVEHGLTLDNNLYWNEGEPFDEKGPANPGDDQNRIVGDPGLETDHSALGAVVWDGSSFPSGTTDIRSEFERLVESYGRLPADSPAVDGADPSVAPAEDILGRSRDESPDLGAFEATG